MTKTLNDLKDWRKKTNSIFLLNINKTYVVYQWYYNNTDASTIPNLFDSCVLL